MAFRVTTDVSTGQIRNAISRKLDPEIRRRAEAAGEQMAKDATDLMASKFNLNRPYERRRWPGSRRAATAISYRVEGDVDSGIDISYRVLGGDQVLQRIIILNFGSSSHTIRPSGNWPLKGQRLYSRASRTQGVTRVSRQDVLAWVDEATGDVVVKGSVNHPGQQVPGRFLEEARDRAVALLQ